MTGIAGLRAGPPQGMPTLTASMHASQPRAQLLTCVSSCCSCNVRSLSSGCMPPDVRCTHSPKQHVGLHGFLTSCQLALQAVRKPQAAQEQPRQALTESQAGATEPQAAKQESKKTFSQPYAAQIQEPSETCGYA